MYLRITRITSISHRRKLKYCTHAGVQCSVYTYHIFLLKINSNPLIRKKNWYSDQDTSKARYDTYWACGGSIDLTLKIMRTPLLSPEDAILVPVPFPATELWGL